MSLGQSGILRNDCKFLIIMHVFSDIERGLFLSAGVVRLLLLDTTAEQMNGNQSH